MSRRFAWAILALACAVPRLVVLLHERERIVTAFTEKSWRFAQTFVASGTFGFMAHVPSASTQPLYGFFLVPIVWIFGTGWLWVGLAQVLVAVVTAVLVYEIGRRVASPGTALLGALIATLHPYLVWHDVHLNREILDQLLGAAMVLLALIAYERRTAAWAAALGAVSGLAILSNTRLVLLPLVFAGFLLWAHARPVAVLALLAATVLVLAPWVVRNRVQVGCFALTTDAKALWKANNPKTYSILAHGGWIDDVPDPPGAPPTPNYAADYFGAHHVLLHVDECSQMRFYEHLVREYWQHHPGGKAKLAAQATWMLWSPAARHDQSGSTTNGIRTVVEPLWAVPVFLLALLGLLWTQRRFRVLVLCLLAYETLAAWVFAGTTRYRAPWDFLLALLASVALARLWSLRPSSRSA